MRYLYLILFTFSITFSIGQTNIIQNGNFESGSSTWTALGPFWNFSNSTNSKCISTLSNYAFHGSADGSYAKSSYGTLYQPITIPASASSAKLSFTLSINTLETTTNSKNDLLDVLLRDASGQVILYTFKQYSNLDGAYGEACQPKKAPYTFNIPSAYWGQALRLCFQGATSPTLGTVFRIDDVKVDVTTGPTNCT